MLTNPFLFRLNAFLQYGRYANDDSLDAWQIAASFGAGVIGFIVGFIVPITSLAISAVYVCLMVAIVAEQFLIIDSQAGLYISIENVCHPL